MISTGGPLRRITSERSPPSAIACTCSVAAERVRIVLQDNDALHGGAVPIDQHNAAFKQTGEFGKVVIVYAIPQFLLPAFSSID